MCAYLDNLSLLVPVVIVYAFPGIGSFPPVYQMCWHGLVKSIPVQSF